MKFTCMEVVVFDENDAVLGVIRDEDGSYIFDPGEAEIAYSADEMAKIVDYMKTLAKES